MLCNDDIKLPPFKMEAVAALATALGLTAVTIRGVFRFTISSRGSLKLIITMMMIGRCLAIWQESRLT